jgi:hypothetical protein
VETDSQRRVYEQLDPAHGYVAVMAYLDREAKRSLAAVRRALAVRTK